MLCSICVEVMETRANFLGLSRKEDDPQMNFVVAKCGQHRTIATLMVSAAEGCLVCKSLWDVLSDSERLSLQPQESTIASLSPRATTIEDGLSGWLTTLSWAPEMYIAGSHVLVVRFANSGGNGDADSEGFDWRQNRCGVCILQPVASTRFGSPRSSPLPKSSNTASLETWSMVAGWLDNCLNNHVSCNAVSIARPWYPTRLLDIGQPGSAEQCARLITSRDVRITGHYCTLSHCWGKVPILQLNRANEESLRAGVLLDHLPKTFRDAVLACRRLGLRYLWIDSLCIMQDDLDEWTHESSLMHLVYSNSHLNLSASASADSSQGLYRDRQAHLLHPTRVNLEVVTVTVENGINVAHNKAILCEVHDMQFWKHNVLNSIINKRGWVFQERLLAPRVLSFGPHQVFWECREQNACELYPEGLPPLIDRDFAVRFKSSNLEHVFLQDTLFKERMANALSVQAFWGILIEMYSTTSLTFPSDKLVAISGVAKKYREDMNDEYIAGMWRKDLANWMLWYVMADPSPRPLAYRAPSWSWASVDNTVGTLRGNVTGMIATVDDVVLHHVNGDITGAISSGWLDLTGPLKPIQIGRRQLKYHLSISNTVKRSQDYNQLDNINEQGLSLFFDEPLQEELLLQDTEHGSRLFCMICRVLPIDPANLPLVMALLVRLADTERKIFTRFGVAIASNLPTRAILLADIDEDTKRNLPCLRYDNGMHTIRII